MDGLEGAMQGEPADSDDAPVYRTDEFRMYGFKIVQCSKRYRHDWTTCPFAHPTEKAKRRNPHSHTGIACPAMKTNLQCPRGDSCKFAHNVFEYWLHPTRYRTQLCNDGVRCWRSICFFAHTLEELRDNSSSNNKVLKPSAVPSSHEQQLQQQQQRSIGINLTAPANLHLLQSLAASQSSGSNLASASALAHSISDEYAQTLPMPAPPRAQSLDMQSLRILAAAAGQQQLAGQDQAHGLDAADRLRQQHQMGQQLGQLLLQQQQQQMGQQQLQQQHILPGPRPAQSGASANLQTAIELVQQHQQLQQQQQQVGHVDSNLLRHQQQAVQQQHAAQQAVQQQHAAQQAVQQQAVQQQQAAQQQQMDSSMLRTQSAALTPREIMGQLPDAMINELVQSLAAFGALGATQIASTVTPQQQPQQQLQQQQQQLALQQRLTYTGPQQQLDTQQQQPGGRRPLPLPTSHLQQRQQQLQQLQLQQQQQQQPMSSSFYLPYAAGSMPGHAGQAPHLDQQMRSLLMRRSSDTLHHSNHSAHGSASHMGTPPASLTAPAELNHMFSAMPLVEEGEIDWAPQFL